MKASQFKDFNDFCKQMNFTPKQALDFLDMQIKQLGAGDAN